MICMKLVTLGIHNTMNLITQFPIFILPYIQTQLILYQIETLQVLTVDFNEKANSCTTLQVIKPHIASKQKHKRAFLLDIRS